MNHTPGPWTISHENFGHFKLDAGDVSIIDGCGYCDSPWLSSEADARLIAAAPDLLEALKKMLDVWEHGGLKPYPIAKARAAIAKATGAKK